MRGLLSSWNALGRSFWPTGEVAALDARRMPVRAPGSHRPVVLLVCGNGRQLHAMRRTLQRNGYRVRIELDGPAALESARQNPPAAVVLEWLMPGSGGVDVCTRLRGCAELPRMPVVLITARGDSVQISEGFAAGADEVLTRPMDPDVLVTFLDRSVYNTPNRPSQM